MRRFTEYDGNKLLLNVSIFIFWIAIADRFVCVVNTTYILILINLNLELFFMKYHCFCTIVFFIKHSLLLPFYLNIFFKQVFHSHICNQSQQPYILVIDDHCFIRLSGKLSSAANVFRKPFPSFFIWYCSCLSTQMLHLWT